MVKRLDFETYKAAVGRDEGWCDSGGIEDTGGNFAPHEKLYRGAVPSKINVPNGK